MRVVCLLGSPRAGGNSDWMAQQLCQRLEAGGATVEVVALRDLSFSGCRALFHCKTGGERCGQSDDLTPVLESLYEAEVWVLATPIYFTDVTSLLKAAIERLFSFFVPDYATNPDKSRLPAGKRLVFLQTQGEAEEAYRDLAERYGKSFQMLGIEDRRLIRAHAVREQGEAATVDIEREIEAVTSELLAAQ